MELNQPIYWHQGLFLQPQHLQLADLYHQSLQAPTHRFQMPHFWGVGALDIRETALGSGLFDINGGEFLFPDGTYLVHPGNVHLEARSFASAWPEDVDTLRVYLGVRKWNPAGGNVTVTPELAKASDLLTRFVTTTDPEDVPDLYHDAPPAQVHRMHYALRIFWGTETDRLNEYDTIPVAELVRDGKEVKLSETYIPPSISHAATPRLNKMVKQIRDQVASRCRQLEDMKKTKSPKAADFETSDMLQFLGMRTLAQHVPHLQHVTEAPDVHPWVIYGAIREVVGALSVFSEKLGASGEVLQDGSRALPLYDHRDLYTCFNAAQLLVSHLLDEIVLGTENVIHLRRESGGLFVGELLPGMADPRSQYYLILRTDNPSAWVQDSILTVAKLGSKASIGALTTRFVSGVPLDFVPYPPGGVPRVAHAVYFHIDRESPQWAEVLRGNGVALYWDTAPDDLMAEIAVQRG